MKIGNIEGIGPAYAENLAAANITTTADLLKNGATRKGRKELADRTGISTKLVLKWVNKADLMRIKGVGEEYSDLLEAAGVDTVRELSIRNAENLYKKIVEVNESKKLVRQTPSATAVAAWVEYAKGLEPIVTY
jgi:predicted flap endonuclease-1-like 5' DNA nuclease